MDTIKHSTVFDPRKFKGSIAVVGLGAIGSAVAMQLAKLGLGPKMNLYDFDVVEGHNLPNQALFGYADIGTFKAEAAANQIAVLTDGSMPMYYNWKVEHKNDLEDEDAVFLCVDSMKMRSEFFQNVVYLNPHITFFADGRMAARSGMVYGFDPTNLEKAKEYRARLYPDDDVPLELIGGCSLTTSVGATAMMVACQMTWVFINHFTYRQNDLKGTPPKEELLFQVDDLDVHSSGYLSR